MISANVYRSTRGLPDAHMEYIEKLNWLLSYKFWVKTRVVHILHCTIKIQQFWGFILTFILKYGKINTKSK